MRTTAKLWTVNVLAFGQCDCGNICQEHQQQPPNSVCVSYLWLVPTQRRRKIYTHTAIFFGVYVYLCNDDLFCSWFALPRLASLSFIHGRSLRGFLLCYWWRTIYSACINVCDCTVSLPFPLLPVRVSVCCAVLYIIIMFSFSIHECERTRSYAFLAHSYPRFGHHCLWRKIMISTI